LVYHLNIFIIDSLAVIAVNSPHNEFTNQKWLTAWNKAKIRLCTDGAANRIVDFCRLIIIYLNSPLKSSIIIISMLF
jgi:peroxiredoxin